MGNLHIVLRLQFKGKNSKISKRISLLMVYYLFYFPIHPSKGPPLLFIYPSTGFYLRNNAPARVPEGPLVLI